MPGAIEDRDDPSVIMNQTGGASAATSEFDAPEAQARAYR